MQKGAMFIQHNSLAEREGFKPPVRTSRTADFESAPFDHSGIFPLITGSVPIISIAKIALFFHFRNLRPIFATILQFFFFPF